MKHAPRSQRATYKQFSFVEKLTDRKTDEEIIKIWNKTFPRSTWDESIPKDKTVFTLLALVKNGDRRDVSTLIEALLD